THANRPVACTPATNFNVPHSLPHKTHDRLLNSNAATVEQTINPVNDAPVAVNDSFATNEDTALTITAPGVLGNDTDIDSSVLTRAEERGVGEGGGAGWGGGAWAQTGAAKVGGSGSSTW